MKFGLLLDTELSGIDLKKAQPSWIVRKITEFITFNFSVGQPSSGVHTIGNYLPTEHRLFAQRMRMRTFLNELFGNLSSFNSKEVAADQKIEDDIEHKSVIIDDLEKQAKEQSKKPLLFKLIKAAFDSLSELKFTWRERNFEREVIEQTRREQDRLRKQLIRERLPIGALEVYSQYRRELIEGNDERDCKIATAVCAYVLKKAKDELNLPIEIKFAIVASKAHPYYKS